jgi:hypothetical protein
MIHDFDFDVHGNNRQQIKLAADVMADTYWGDEPFEITSISVEKQHVGAYSARVYTRAVEPKDAGEGGVPHPYECPTVVMPSSGTLQILSSRGQWLNVVLADYTYETSELLVAETVETEINIDRDEYLDEVRQYYFAADDDGTLDALAHDNWPAVRSIAALIYDDVLPSLMKGKAK